MSVILEEIDNYGEISQFQFQLQFFVLSFRTPLAECGKKMKVILQCLDGQKILLMKIERNNYCRDVASETNMLISTEKKRRNDQFFVDMIGKYGRKNIRRMSSEYI